MLATLTSTAICLQESHYMLMAESDSLAQLKLELFSISNQLPLTFLSQPTTKSVLPFPGACYVLSLVLKVDINVPCWIERVNSKSKHYIDKNVRNGTSRAQIVPSYGGKLYDSTMIVPFLFPVRFSDRICLCLIQ